MTASRHLFHAGNKQAVDLLHASLENICGAASLHFFEFLKKTYSNVEAEIAGTTNELVVIGAHLDSTAANDEGYDAETDPAPGADDDGSGVLAVLEVARVLRELADVSPPDRSIRFALFNAEEQWMRGSWAYAHKLKEFEGEPGGPTVVAMLAMDMIGWHPPGTPPFAFEIHGTGSANTEYKNVAASSAQLVAAVAQAATETAPGALTAQVYPLPGCATDPATDRSDHSSFHYHDWPACLLSEDLWIDVCAGGDKKAGQAGNPHYHKASDVFDHLDLAYAADIARTVATAAWKLANP